MVNMSYKRLVLIFTASLAVFVALNFVLWKNYTEDLLTSKNYVGGDLARIWYIYDSKYFRRNSCDLPRRHLQLKDYNLKDSAGGNVDFITIGDSFSNGGGGGKNHFYQDYIASINDLKVLNICRHRDLDPVTTVSILLNSGFFDRFKTHYVLISLAERGSGDELTRPLDFNKKMSFEELQRLKTIEYYSKHPDVGFLNDGNPGDELTRPLDFNKKMSFEELQRLRTIEYYSKQPDVGFLNDGNPKFVFYTLFYHFSDYSFLGERRIWKLNKPMFTVKNSDKLLSIKYKRIVNENDVKVINDNLNNLSDRLKTKGITLVYMPIVDKLNLYGKFLIDKSYSKSSFFEYLRVLPKRYIFIDTKAILLEELEKGEKDIFYADDTHWSWKASKKIFSVVRFGR
jgi:hypothetical protein